MNSEKLEQLKDESQQDMLDLSQPQSSNAGEGEQDREFLQAICHQEIIRFQPATICVPCPSNNDPEGCPC